MAVSFDTTLPSTIHYRKENSPEQKMGLWIVYLYFVQIIGKSLRDNLYLPLYNKKIEQANRAELALATECASALRNGTSSEYKKFKLIQDHFSIRDMAVHIEGETTRIFTVRLFESKETLREKKLRIILFSFNGNTEGPQGSERRWEPLTMKMLSEAPLDVLKALKKAGIIVNFLFTTSLGNLTYHGLKYLPDTDLDIIPSTWIINRGLVSIRKIASQLFSPPLSYILYGAAKLAGWDANPEQDILDFFKRSPQGFDGTPRKIMIIEALKDHYTSGAGGFDPDFHQKIQLLKVLVFRATFFPFLFHERSHHSLSLAKLTHNSATKIAADTFLLNMAKGEKISTTIARVLSNHATCFYVCGNITTLDMGTLEIVPLLDAFIKKG